MKTDALLLDTHVWVNYQLYPDILRPKTIAAIDVAAERDAVYVSVVSVWELAMLERDGRVEFDKGIRQWVDDALSIPGITLLDYSPRIAIESVYLPEPMHKDPADRILVASAIIEKMTLVTADKAILAFAKATNLAHLRA